MRESRPREAQRLAPGHKVRIVLSTPWVILITHLPSGHKEGMFVPVNSCGGWIGASQWPVLAERCFVITASPGQDRSGKHRPLDGTVSQAETTASGSPVPAAYAATGQQRAAARSRPRTVSTPIRANEVARGQRQVHVRVMKANRSSPGLSEAGGSEERDIYRCPRSRRDGAVVAACRGIPARGIQTRGFPRAPPPDSRPKLQEVWPRAVKPQWPGAEREASLQQKNQPRHTKRCRGCPQSLCSQSRVNPQTFRVTNSCCLTLSAKTGHSRQTTMVAYLSSEYT